MIQEPLKKIVSKICPDGVTRTMHIAYVSCLLYQSLTSSSILPNSLQCIRHGAWSHARPIPSYRLSTEFFSHVPFFPAVFFNALRKHSITNSLSQILSHKHSQAVTNSFTSLTNLVCVLNLLCNTSTSLHNRNHCRCSVRFRNQSPIGGPPGLVRFIPGIAFGTGLRPRPGPPRV